jgi:hypothetical protein
MKPWRIILWDNGMVMVFDALGNQVPTDQGRWADRRAELAVLRETETTWQYGKWSRGQLIDLTKREVMALGTLFEDSP